MMHYHYFVYDSFNENEFFKTEEEALAYAQELLDDFREYAYTEGWGEDVENIVVPRSGHPEEVMDFLESCGFEFWMLLPDVEVV